MSYLMGQFFGMCRFEAEIAYDIIFRFRGKFKCSVPKTVSPSLFVANNEVKMSRQTTQ